MKDVGDLTVQILIQIRDRLDETNQRLDSTNQRLDSTNQRLDAVVLGLGEVRDETRRVAIKVDHLVARDVLGRLSRIEQHLGLEPYPGR